MLLTGIVVAIAGGSNWVCLVHSLSEGTVDSPGWDLVVVLGGILDWLLEIRIQRTVKSKLRGSVLLKSQESTHHSIGIGIVPLGCVFPNGLTDLGHGLGTSNVEPLASAAVLLQEATGRRQAADAVHNTGGNVSFLDLLDSHCEIFLALFGTELAKLNVSNVAIDASASSTKNVVLMKISDRTDTPGGNLDLWSGSCVLLVVVTARL